MAERQRAECGQRPLAVLGDAGQFLHRAVVQKIFFLSGGNFDEAGAFRGVGGELGEFSGIGKTRRDRKPRLFQNPFADALDIIRRRGVAPDVRVHAGKIQKALVNGVGHERRRVLFQDQKHLAGQFAVGVIMRTAQDTGRAKPFRLKTGRAGLDAVFLRLPVGRNNDAVAAPATADPHRTPLQFGIERDFATGEEGISVNVQNAVVASAHRQQTRYRIARWRPFRVVHKRESAKFAWTFAVPPSTGLGLSTRLMNG